MIDLRPWPGLSVAGVLGGGHRNTVYELHGHGRFVARRSRRTAAGLGWELDLLALLADHGFAVPRVVPAADGSRSVDGVVVQTWIDGDPPDGADSQLVARELSRLHRLTGGRVAQRPGFASTADLLVAERGGDVDLTAMPADAVASCRAAWSAIDGVPLAVVHGDPGASNVRMQGERVGLIDWDEARVDHVDLDLADLPDGPLRGDRAATAAAAADAWEAACAWTVEPSYARLRLRRLRDRQSRA